MNRFLIVIALMLMCQSAQASDNPTLVDEMLNPYITIIEREGEVTVEEVKLVLEAFGKSSSLISVDKDNSIVIDDPKEVPGLDQIKGLRFVTKVPFINENGKMKKKKVYSYELLDGSIYTTDTKLPGVTDLTKFDEVHPKLARIRDIVSFAATIISFASLIVLMFI